MKVPDASQTYLNIIIFKMHKDHMQPLHKDEHQEEPLSLFLSDEKTVLFQT